MFICIQSSNIFSECALLHCFEWIKMCENGERSEYWIIHDWCSLFECRFRPSLSAKSLEQTGHLKRNWWLVVMCCLSACFDARICSHNMQRWVIKTWPCFFLEWRYSAFLLWNRMGHCVHLYTISLVCTAFMCITKYWLRPYDFEHAGNVHLNKPEPRCFRFTWCRSSRFLINDLVLHRWQLKLFLVLLSWNPIEWNATASWLSKSSVHLSHLILNSVFSVLRCIWFLFPLCRFLCCVFALTFPSSGFVSSSVSDICAIVKLFVVEISLKRLSQPTFTAQSGESWLDGWFVSMTPSIEDASMAAHSSLVFAADRNETRFKILLTTDSESRFIGSGFILKQRE